MQLAITNSHLHVHTSKHTPLEEHLDEFVGAGEGAIRGQQYPAVVLLLTAGVQKVRDQLIQRSRF